VTQADGWQTGLSVFVLKGFFCADSPNRYKKCGAGCIKSSGWPVKEVKLIVNPKRGFWGCFGLKSCQSCLKYYQSCRFIQKYDFR